MSTALKKSLSVLGVTSVLLGGGMLTAGAATASPAATETAAKPSTSADGNNDRLVGPFITRSTAMTNQPIHFMWNAWKDMNAVAGGTSKGGVFGEAMQGPMSVTTAPPEWVARAAEYTFPGEGKIGEVRPTSNDAMCLTTMSADEISKVELAPCAGLPGQQWMHKGNELRTGADGSASISEQKGVPGPGNMIRTAQVSAIEQLDPTLLKPVVAHPDLSAVVESSNSGDKTAVLTGHGTPGSEVIIKDKDGQVIGNAIVDEDGNWKTTIGGLVGGSNPIHVYSPDGEGANDATGIDLNVDMPIAGLTAGIDFTDNEHKTADLSGTGEPGATITLTYPDDQTVTTTVDKDGNWHAETPNLTEGDNNIHVSHSIDGKETANTDLNVMIGEPGTPAVNPTVAAGVLGLALAGASLRRFKKAKI